MTSAETSIQDEYRAFESWALRRKKPAYVMSVFATGGEEMAGEGCIMLSPHF